MHPKMTPERKAKLRQFLYGHEGKKLWTTEHRAIAPQSIPVSTYRQGEYEIRVFSAGHAEGSLKPSGRVRMPEMEV